MTEKSLHDRADIDPRSGSVTEVNLVHADSDDVLETLTAQSIPVPDIDDIVAINDVTISGRTTESAERDVERGEGYRVMDKEVQYNRLEVNVEDSNEDDLVSATVYLFVLTLDEYEERE